VSDYTPCKLKEIIVEAYDIGRWVVIGQRTQRLDMRQPPANGHTLDTPQDCLAETVDELSAQRPNSRDGVRSGVNAIDPPRKGDAFLNEIHHVFPPTVPLLIGFGNNVRV
jgi:hypothetical protein